MPKRFIHRHQPQMSAVAWIKVGVGGALGIGIVALLSDLSGTSLLIAPFGATAVLLFSVPSSALAQPANVIGGHLVVSVLAIGMRAVLPPEWWAIGLAVGAALLVMAMLRITHPPAGANPIVIFLTDPGIEFLFAPILVGSVALVVIAFVVHRIPPQAEYPISALKQEPEEGNKLGSISRPPSELL
ncbi:MAG: HPP family protein [Rhodospirillales bacterium]|nr:HPP family protein [Rhodospirillales bacterium]